MSIFDLQDVAYQRVCCKGVGEVVHSRLVSLRLNWPKLDPVVVRQVHVEASTLNERLLDVINAESIGDELDNATILSGREDFVWSQFQLELPLLEDEINGLNELHSELLRSQIIATFDNDSNQFPSLKVSIL